MSDAAEFSDIRFSTDPDRPIDERREDARHRIAIDHADVDHGRQPFFYARPVESDVRLAVKRAMALDLKECRWSREQVADALSRLIGRSITQVQIDAWVAETKEHRLAAEYVPAWVRVTGSTRVLDLLCAEAGCWLADAVEHDLADYGRSILHREQLTARLTMLERQLQGRF
jgi:hypothetical protein